MKPLPIISSLLIALLMNPAIRAQAPDLTGVIQPFVNNFTIAAARLDVAGADVDALDRWLHQVLDAARLNQPDRVQLEQELNQRMKQARQWSAEFKQAGGRTIWVLWSIESLPAHSPLFIVLPLNSGADAPKLRALLAEIAPGGPDHPEILESRNTLVIAGDRGALDWIRNLKPASRPQLASALSAAGAGRLQIALIPSADARKVAESMAPSLPDGQPASVLARDMVWASLAAQSPPDLTVRLVIQSPDAPAAAELAQSLTSLAQWWHHQSPMNATEKLLIDQATALTDQLQVRGDRIEVAIDAKRSVAIAAQIGRGLRIAQQMTARRQSASNITQLLLGCVMYANNDVKHHLFPETLDKMLQQQDIAAAATVNPRRPEEKPGYIYLRPPEPIINVPAERLVIYENFKDFDGGVDVGFGDGHAEFINNEADFRKLLQEAQQKQKQAGGQ